MSLLLCLGTFLAGNDGPLVGIAQLTGLTLAVNVGLGVYVFGCALLLFLGGLGLIRRRPWGRRLHLVYAWVTVGLIGAYAGMWLFSLATCAPEGRNAIAETAWHSISPWLPHLLYPTVLIIWFLRPRIKQQVQEWQAPAM
jgi:multisubunit Na+/H+ antiporter MnhG subunit